MRFVICSILCWMLLLSTSTANGQTSSQVIDLPLVTPPSPNAASLGKYGDIPVGLYTGIPNISIPLYTISVGKFNLPISLSYHSQGLKVEERAGWVGLGWNLNAGGTVTRSVRGLADDLNGGYWGYSALTLDSITKNALILQNLTGGALYDFQPDQFYYNFGSASGKFLMEAGGTHAAHFIPYAPLKVAYTANASGILSFTMVDEGGITYVFGAVESTLDEVSDVMSNSAWYLTRIITPAGDINFTYTAETTNTTSYTETQYLNANPGADANNYNPGYSQVWRDMANYTVILSSITFPSGSVSFSKAARKDFASASAINGMTVMDMNGKTVHQFSFKESYFGDTTSSAPEAVRLKLDSVIEVPTDGSQSRIFALGYNNPSGVPSVKSLAQDDWGFYNGKTYNVSLLPYLDPTVYGAYVANQEFHSGDRTPSGSAAQTGVLSSITYPTGGVTQFIYEGNTYGSQGPTTVTQYPKVSLLANAQVTSTSGPYADTTAFTISTAQTVSLVQNGKYSGPAPIDNGPTVAINKVNTNGTRSTIYMATEVDTTTTIYQYLDTGKYELLAVIDGVNQRMSGQLSYYSYDTVTKDLIKSLPTGGIRIKRVINTDPVAGLQQYRNYNYMLTTDTGKSSGNLGTVPGYFEQLSSYLYPGQSYDLISAASRNYLGSTQGSHIGYSTVTVSDSSSTGTNGKEVNYFNATYSNSNANLYAVTANGIYHTLGLETLQRYQTDYGVYTGYQTGTDTYNAAGTLVKRSRIHYNTDSGFITTMPNYFEIGAIAGYQYQICQTNCMECKCPLSSNCSYCGNYALDNFTLATYKVVCPWIYKISEFDTTYDVNGTNPVGVGSWYYYDNPTHAQVTRMVQTDSRGDSMKTVTMYPGDKAQITGLGAAASSTLDSMVARNMITSVEEDMYHAGALTARSRTDFALWGGPRRNIAPVSLWKQVGTNAIEQRISYQKYDTANNLMQAAKVGDLTTSYIFDYKNQFPIASVTNADSASIAYTSFEADGTGRWTISGGSIGTSAGAFTGTKALTLASGNSLSKSGLNTARKYIVSYWVKRTTALTVSGASGGALITKNGWTYCQHLLPAGNSSVSITGTGTLDEVRCYPADAYMTSFTYAPLVGPVTIEQPDGRTTFYEYDGLTRLKRIRDMDHNVVKQIDYQYFTQTYYNQADTGYYPRTTCLAGGIGSLDTIIIAPGTYVSHISQADANQQALNYLAANGWNLANSTGYCTYYNTIQIDSFQRSNCGCLTTGTYVYDTAQAGTYTSRDSVGGANKIAQAALMAQGPGLANTKGSCVSTCTGSNHKAIGCTCQTGTLEIVSQYETGSGSTLACITVYGYYFSDGTYQTAYTISNGGHCP